MKVREACALSVEFVEIGCFQYLVAHATQVAHALIIGHDQDDIGPAAEKIFLGILSDGFWSIVDTGKGKQDNAYHKGNAGVERPS